MYGWFLFIVHRSSFIVQLQYALMFALALLLATAGAPQTDVADRVKAEFLQSWRAYEKYAWGHDELRPMTKTPRDWYGESLLMTPVDALDTMLLMGLNDEA